VFRPISRGKLLGRERGGGYLAQSESIAGSELRMAHLFIQKYMNNSLILNIQIADTYLFYPHAIYFLTSLRIKNIFSKLVSRNLGWVKEL